MRTVLCLLLIASWSPAAAQDAQRLHATKSFRCDFPVNVTGNMEGDAPKPEIQRTAFDLVFDQIDGVAQTGRMIGNLGAEDLSVLKAKDAVTLLEVLGSGVVQVTVIYSAQTTEGRFKAVHSRHTSILGNPVPSQYYGTCRALGCVPQAVEKSSGDPVGLPGYAA